MWAMVVKEFTQVRRDRRTVMMMVLLPLLMLVMFGYAATFDVSSVKSVVVGPRAGEVVKQLDDLFVVTRTEPSWTEDQARNELRDGRAVAAFVTSQNETKVLLDGSEVFASQSAKAELSRVAVEAASGRGRSPGVAAPTIEVLYNPDLKTAAIMIPGLAGVILVFVGTTITCLGVVRERQTGTLEQLAVMPLAPLAVFLGKVVPYFLVAAVNLVLVLATGVWLFDVPFIGSIPVLALASLLFLFVTLGTGVLISSLSENQGQAVQMAMMNMFPQMLLAGVIFPIDSIAWGIRWISYCLPLTHFYVIAKGVMLRGQPIAEMWVSFVVLLALAIVILGAATLRFRAFLAPAPSRGDDAGDRSAARDLEPIGERR